MRGRLKTPVKQTRPSSQTLYKIAQIHRNLRKIPTKIWADAGRDGDGAAAAEDSQGSLRTLTPNHRLRRTLGSCPVGDGAAAAHSQGSLRTLTLNHRLLRTLDSCPVGALREFNQVHAQLVVSGISQHPLAASRAVKKLCASPTTFRRAVSVFDRLEEPDAFIGNTVMRGYAVTRNDPSGALTFFYQRMLGYGVFPNHYTFPLLVKICAELGAVPHGERAHAQIVKFGFELHLFVRNSLIHMYFAFRKIGAARVLFGANSDPDLVTFNSMIHGYVKNGDINAARGVFDVMCERDAFSWNSMISGYVGIGNMKDAIDLFEQMPLKDVVSWNCVIDGYARIGGVMDARKVFDRMPIQNTVSWNSMLALYVRCKDYGECLELFDRMIAGGEVKPNEATLVSVLTACAHSGRMDRGKWVHFYIRENSSRIKPDVLLSTSLLTMYAKCGAMELARSVFDEMPEKSVVSWNSIIMGYGMQGHGKEALELFLEMEKSGPLPNAATFACVLCACTHAGMVLEGWWYFDRMHRIYKIEPRMEHYGCMVDLLGRAGLMKDSEELIKKVTLEVGPASWGALLSACRTHSNLVLGEFVAKRLMELQPGDVGPYVLLSNIYAAEGKWDSVESMRKKMKEHGMQKTAGSSLVHLGGFESKSHLENDSVHERRMIYSMLGEIGTQIKLSCRD